mmetsp:Transcript_8896/g.14821  ORF Transcript_8896/g.14821 Transcript_8896/m.14821 type:complete len:599 (-) Transcript_8896:75-1871(-)|eukprot:CAMPEP_0119007930 /NCGR_PEP_ID=MMETSP1176-20130426/3341_1 /TAXON_ID=265551 /ORGANISM="Synedropsis recta cf, Strain CCMP1620" /LENGTH=598 /DNA_ID=CAMNT_0006960165 /DNA_START=282 /DNA_END=2078 /DNA_ORIENTATION=-
MGKGSGSGKGAVVGQSQQELNSSTSYLIKHPLNVTPKGLENVGNTCYANAALQCLLSTSLSHALLEPDTLVLLRGYASNSCLLVQGSGSVDSQDADEGAKLERLTRKEKRRKRREERKTREKSEWLTRQLTQVTREYAVAEPESSSWFYSGQAPIVDPGSITRHPERLSKCLSPYRQEDAHEFMRALLSTLTMNGLNKQLSSLFDGLLESAVTCQCCGHSSLTRDRYMDLSLDIVSEQVNTLGDALCEFTKTELLDHDNMVMCGNCQRKQPVEKGLRLATAPSILVCHLKRFAYDDYGNMIRLHKHVSFPLRLEIGDYMSRVNKAKPPAYELVAVLVHQGRSCECGHYLAYVKCQNEWYKANDSQISKVDVETVLSQQAYILMYEVAGMSSSTLQTFKPVQNSWKHEDVPSSPEFQGSRAPKRGNVQSSIFDMLCGISEATNDAIVRDFCCGAILQPDKPPPNNSYSGSSQGPFDEFNMTEDYGVRRRYYQEPDCDDTIGNSTMGDGSTVYTTDSSQISVLRKSNSGGNLRGLEVEASRAYRRKPRTHSFTESDPGAKNRSHQPFYKPRGRSQKAPSPTLRPPRPGHRRRHSSAAKQR